MVLNSRIRARSRRQTHSPYSPPPAPMKNKPTAILTTHDRVNVLKTTRPISCCQPRDKNRSLLPCGQTSTAPRSSFAIRMGSRPDCVSWLCGSSSSRAGISCLCDSSSCAGSSCLCGGASLVLCGGCAVLILLGCLCRTGRASSGGLVILVSEESLQPATPKLLTYTFFHHL